jgi:hypothetical protein
MAEYVLYYLPYQGSACQTGPADSCPTPYLARTETASEGWRRRAIRRLRMAAVAAGWGGKTKVSNRTRSESGWRRDAAAIAIAAAAGSLPAIPAAAAAAAAQTGESPSAAVVPATATPSGLVPLARVLGFEARTIRDSFYPMEVSATAAERAWLEDQNSPARPLHSSAPFTARPVDSPGPFTARPVLVFAEPRERPIRMLDAPPFEWVRRGAAPPNGTTVSLAGRPGEFLVF